MKNPGTWRVPLALAALLLTGVADAGNFTSPPVEAVTSWIGNSYGGARKWVQQDIHALTVLPDGTVYTNVEWDEGGGNAGEYRDGELIRYAGHTHGWGNSGGEAVAANSRYLFLAVQMGNEGGGLRDPETWPPKGMQWLGVSRRPRAEIASGAPFAGGKGGKGDTLKASFLVVAEVPDKPKAALPGICANETRLYVADASAGSINVYDTETMQPLTQWKIERAGPLALDAAGAIWMLQRKTDAGAGRLVRFSAQGEEQAPAFNFPSEISPVAFCFASDGRVLVADDGPAQQIRIYTVQGGALSEAGTFGERGGIASGTPSAVGDRKLNRVTAIGCDARDNLYLAQDGQSGGGGTVLESYRLAGGALNWRLQGLTFVDMADVDAASDAEVFTKEEHFRSTTPGPPDARRPMWVLPSGARNIRRTRGGTFGRAEPGCGRSAGGACFSSTI